MTSAPSTFALLSDAERGRVLQHVFETHPELRDEAERLALDLLTGIDRDTVAVDVQIALEAVSTAEVAAASGRQRGGYVAAEIGVGILDGLELAKGDEECAIFSTSSSSRCTPSASSMRWNALASPRTSDF